MRRWLISLILVLAATPALAVSYSYTSPSYHLGGGDSSRLRFPELNGRQVVDEAQVLSPATVTQLDGLLAGLEKQTTDQVVVVTLRSLQGHTIEDYGYQLGRHWEVGQKGKNNGALLIIAPNEHKVRIEVGYGLEGTMTDAQASIIVQSIILPRFKAGQMEDGILRGTEGIITVLNGGTLPAALLRQPQQQESGGFGTIFMVIFMVLFLLGMLKSNRNRPSGFGGIATGLILGSMLNRDSGSSDSSGGTSDFSGGGGDFGGGGDSGSW